MVALCGRVGCLVCGKKGVARVFCVTCLLWAHTHETAQFSQLQVEILSKSSNIYVFLFPGGPE